MTDLVIDVAGVPAPQGSKRAFVRGGRAVVVESSAGVAPWREAVVWHALRALRQSRLMFPFDGPVEVSIDFYLTRPKGHYGTGRNAGILRPSAPAFPAVKPDLDKLIRATWDALTIARVWRDDAQVVSSSAGKTYRDRPGATIRVEGDGTWLAHTEGAA